MSYFRWCRCVTTRTQPALDPPSFAITEGVGFGKANISFAFRGMQTKFPPNMRGWETGTLSVDDVKVTIDDAADADLIGVGSKGTKLTIRTAEHTESVPKREAEVGSDGRSVSWALDDVRIPVYARYASSVVFELGSVSSIKKLLPGVDAQPDAIAVLWMQDLTDDVEQLVKLPVLAGSDLATVRQNAINDQTAKHHDFRVVGWLETRLKLDSGLDENHEEIIKSLPQSRRHALQAYDRVEGEAEIARKNAHAADDGVIDKREQSQIDKAHKRQLENRGRGPAQIKAYRTAKWMKGGWRPAWGRGRALTRTHPPRRRHPQPPSPGKAPLACTQRADRGVREQVGSERIQEAGGRVIAVNIYDHVRDDLCRVRAPRPRPPATRPAPHGRDVR